MELASLLSPNEILDERRLGKTTAFIYRQAGDFMRSACLEVAALGQTAAAEDLIDELDPCFTHVILGLLSGKDADVVVAEGQKIYKAITKSIWDTVDGSACEGNPFRILGAGAGRAIKLGIKSADESACLRPRVIVTPSIDVDEPMWLVGHVVEVSGNRCIVPVHFNPAAKQSLSSIMTGHTMLMGIGHHLGAQQPSETCELRLPTDRFDRAIVSHYAKKSLLRNTSSLPAGWPRLAGYWLEQARAAAPRKAREQAQEAEFYVALRRLDFVDGVAHSNLLVLFDRAHKDQRTRLVETVRNLEVTELGDEILGRIARATNLVQIINTLERWRSAQ